MHLSAALLVGLLGAAQAHTVVRNAYVNGQSPGLGVCLRLSDEGWNNAPVKPYSNDMACGINGNKGAARTCPVKAGDTITFEYYHERTPEFNYDYLADSHLGPCSISMKKVDSALKDPAVGDGWFRIAYEDYNNQTGKWCTSRVSEGGFLSAVLPTDLPGGDYLIRSELLALHAAPQDDPQFYVACMQVFVDSAGSSLPKDTVAIPSDAYAKIGDEAMTWNLYDGRDDSTYPGYGPPTYVSSGAVDPNAKFEGTQTEGLRPTNCIMEVRNWCATPEPSYDTEDECWTANKNCWDQNDKCNQGKPLDYKMCEMWAARCRARQDTCKGGKATGPDTKDMTPPAPTISPPAPFDQSAGKSNIRPQAVAGSSGSSSSSTSSSSTATATAEGSNAQVASPTTSLATFPTSEASSPQDSSSSSTNTAAAETTGGSDSGSAPSAATSDVAALETSETCPTAVTETVTEMVTVTATTSTVVDSTATPPAKSYGYRRARRAA